MRVVGLFAGVGGIELGLRQAGFATSLLCEIDLQARAVLEERFPGITIEPDVTRIGSLPRNVDILTAGFPCQDLSQVGKTNGIFGARSGLIQSVFSLISDRKPPWILLENVPFLLRLHRGHGISYVVNSLERLGYRWAYRIIDTRAFGLPQRRERVFLLASRDEDPYGYLFASDGLPPTTSQRSDLAHGFYWTEGTRGLGWAVNAVPTIKGGSGVGIPSPPAIWFSDGRFATPDIRDAERLQGFPANWTRAAESAGRSSYRWTLVGNAVSVPIARWIGRNLATRNARVPDLKASALPEGAPWPRAAFGGTGIGRFSVDIGSFPVRRASKHLHEFLQFDPKPLSYRAAAGFRIRLQRSSLARPAAFDEALNAFVERHAR